MEKEGSVFVQALQRMVKHVEMRTSDIAERADAMLALLSCARAEVLWWFQHWGEVRHRSPPLNLLSTGTQWSMPRGMVRSNRSLP